MKKFLITVLLLSCICALALLPASAEQSRETLFSVSDKGAFCVDPKPWIKGAGSLPLVTGEKDVICENADRSYPLCFDNSSNADSHYRICGTNTVNSLIRDPALIEYMKDDYAVEYTVKYSDASSGHISVLLAYNSLYYIDVYVNAYGRGDILLCENGKNTSLVKSDSLLSPTDGRNLIDAVLGEEAETFVGRGINLTLRVGVDEVGMPDSIDLYVNGMLAAQTDSDKMGNNIPRLAPEYELVEGAAFSHATLGNITALNCSSDAVGELEGLAIYPTEETEPSDAAIRKYASLYGNKAYDRAERAEKAYDRDAHILLCVLFGVIDAVLVGAAVVIIIYRRKEEKQT